MHLSFETLNFPIPILSMINLMQIHKYAIGRFVYRELMESLASV